MKKRLLLLFIFLSAMSMAFSSDSRTVSNGEKIYRKGKNKSGETLLDKDASRIKIAKSCQTCHGRHGDAMRSVSISYSYLSDPKNFEVPYTDSLLFRFLDEDLRSDGSKADIGVIWKMSDEDKKDLVAYLKTL
jgi:cytochrome c553